MENEIMKKENVSLTFGSTANLADLLAEEMDGLTLSFERIRIPAGGGVAFEVPGDDPENPDMVKEFKAVILYHHPIHCYYEEEYSGGNNPPDCGSMDGHVGVEASTGEIKQCSECPMNKFGSGKNGAKACKQKRRIYLLREGESLPTLMSLPTGSLSEFSKYVMRLLSKGRKTNAVVTKFSLKKAQNAGGINYSQAVFAVDRMLTVGELEILNRTSEQVKTLANRVTVLDEE